MLFSKDGTVLYSYPKGKGSISYIVPDGTLSIASCSFYGEKNLQTIVFPLSLQKIGYSAFRDTNLLEAYFYGNAPTLGTVNNEHSFVGTSQLFTAYYLQDSSGFTENTGNWSQIYRRPFDGDDSPYISDVNQSTNEYDSVLEDIDSTRDSINDLLDSQQNQIEDEYRASLEQYSKSEQYSTGETSYSNQDNIIVYIVILIILTGGVLYLFIKRKRNN